MFRSDKVFKWHKLYQPWKHHIQKSQILMQPTLRGRVVHIGNGAPRIRHFQPPESLLETIYPRTSTCESAAAEMGRWRSEYTRWWRCAKHGRTHAPQRMIMAWDELRPARRNGWYECPLWGCPLWGCPLRINVAIAWCFRRWPRTGWHTQLRSEWHMIVCWCTIMAFWLSDHDVASTSDFMFKHT